MEDRINESVLCVLKMHKSNSIIEIDYIKIEMSLHEVIDKFCAMCDSPSISLQDIINFIKSSVELNKLNTSYKYCTTLYGKYQGFVANNQNVVKEIITVHNIMLLNYQKNPEKHCIKKAVKDYKEELKLRYILWNKAYSIYEAYLLCTFNLDILTFSHREEGWSNPVYQLTPNFSVEIKTNFGFGSKSYFYTKLKYKNIAITPFSEWIIYEKANFSEIIRYSKSHRLSNEYWQEAMEFSRDACNISLTDEELFIEKYVIAECEKMVSGLEMILNEDVFKFMNYEENLYQVNKEGHALVEFRGEKVSGALDFISLILEFENIALIKSFIQRIEECNKTIQPILLNESKLILKKIDKLKIDKSLLQNQYDALITKNNFYDQKKVELQAHMLSNGKLVKTYIDKVKLNSAFNSIYPHFELFSEEFKKISANYRILCEQIHNSMTVCNKIVSYNNKIVIYNRK